MGRPVCYDVTRLLTRVLNATPNGIDRIDSTLARHFLSGPTDITFGATATGIGARLLGGAAAAEAVAAIDAHWGETTSEIESDPVYADVVAWLTGAARRDPSAKRRRRALPLDLSGLDLRGILGWMRRHGLRPRTTPRTGLPPRSVYINASQFPLWVASSFEWLEERPDVRAAFFIHDLLPILLPEYFRKGEPERHRARLRNFARFGTAAIVTTRTVAADFGAHMETLGRKDVPIFIAATPVSATFLAPRVVVPTLGGLPYFVFCSTIEPRKNHLMLLAVWRALVARLGKAAPKLVLVGTRGWHYDAILDLIERSPPLRDTVIEVGGLSTPGLKRLIDNARALLMPTFGEGYGLPVLEALAAGAPVIASDIPVFREIEARGLTLVSPLDGEAWLESIATCARTDRPVLPAPARQDWSGYFNGLDAFVDTL